MEPVPLHAVRDAVQSLAPDVVTRPDVPIHLDWNESRWPLPEGLKEAIAAATASADPRPYPDIAYPGVREDVARMADWDPAGVIFGNGGDDMLQLAGAALTGSGTRALYPSPGFSMYPWSLRLAGAEAVAVPLASDLSYDLDAFFTAIARWQPSLIFLTNPHNPTGELLPLDVLRKLAERTPGFLLIDEAYHEFSGLSARPLLEEFGNVILLRTFSKAMALAGARLGYLVMALEAADVIRRAQPPFPVGIFTCRAARAARGFRPQLLVLVARIVAERESLAERLRALPGVEVWPSATNFLLFRSPLHSAVLAARLLARGISLRDFSRHPLLGGTLRVTVGTPEENRAFLGALEECFALGEPRPQELAAAGDPESPIA